MTVAMDPGEMRGLVDRAVKAAVPPDQMVERKVRPESEYGWPEPRPLAGLQAALTVVRMAQDQAYRFAKALRGEGASWTQIADLLEIPWSEDYVRRDRAYELVAGPASANSRDRPRVYWTCGGAEGCGKDIIDYGPYDGHPADTESGHENCRRYAAEIEAYRLYLDDLDRRSQVMDEAMDKVTDEFGRETVNRARYVQSHGGRYLGWSTSETLAVALVLNDDDELKRHGYTTRGSALARVLNRSAVVAAQLAADHAWLKLLRAAATGEG